MTKKQLEELQEVFNSIACLATEGPEFYCLGKTTLTTAIAREASRGYDLCKSYGEGVSEIE